MSEVKRVLYFQIVDRGLGTPNLAIQCSMNDLAMDSAVMVETGMASGQPVDWSTHVKR